MFSRSSRFLAAFVGATVAVALAGTSCGTNDAPRENITLKGEALRDPKNCLPCHEEQVREWSSSMHAYAGDDPVFLAMNKRMVRETGGASATFCVSCHAPVALRLGLTKDGTNLAELPSSMRGVTCYFCHTTESVEGTHNNPLKLADDDVMRGKIRDPIAASPHRNAYSPLLDRDSQESSKMCGACHDVVTTHGSHIERSFEEWKSSLYARPGQLSCAKCHMDGRDGLAANVPGAPRRRVHDHSMPAVDIALTPFFGADTQRAAVQRLLDTALITKLCVRQTPLGPLAEVTLDNAFAGHHFPSGVAHDRRVWVELIAYKDGAPVFSSGVVSDGTAAARLSDPNMWLLRDKIFRPDGKETHMFWEAASYTSELLPVAVTNDPLDPKFNHSVTRSYALPTVPDRVTMRVRMRPVDFDLIDDLVASGDLDPVIRERIPTFNLASGTKEWTSDLGFAKCAD